MDTQTFIRDRIRSYYWDQDLNCATVSLLILAERFGMELSGQVLDAAAGMHGAGKYGAQCGLVEGPLMFLGLAGRQFGWAENEIETACRGFAAGFEGRFSSLLCAVLRPGGFNDDDPPHLCEDLTRRAVSFSIDFAEDCLNR
ncbi:MAG: C-GCAxxG-C-C family protein [Desulfonatronovibrionaceae bacterium]